MPHDMKGKKLKAGDKVNVPCIVKDLQSGTEYCNVTLQTAVPMPPYTEGSSIVLNTKQVKKATAEQWGWRQGLRWAGGKG